MDLKKDASYTVQTGYRIYSQGVVDDSVDYEKEGVPFTIVMNEALNSAISSFTSILGAISIMALT